MNESICNRTTSSALIRPTTRHASTATAMADSSDQPCCTFSTAIVMAASDIVDTADRSNSPAVSGTMSPRARTSRTAWEPRMFCRLLAVG